MNQLLTIIIMAAAVVVSPAQADDLFSRIEQADRDFWRRGARTLWTAGAPDRSALIEVLLSDDHEGDEEIVVDTDNPVGGREADFTEKWAEALGQALSYAASTGLQPGIFLVCCQAPRNCLLHRLRLDEAITAWGLPVAVWNRDG